MEIRSESSVGWAGFVLVGVDVPVAEGVAGFDWAGGVPTAAVPVVELSEGPPLTLRFSAMISTSFVLKASLSSSAFALSPLTPPVKVNKIFAFWIPVALMPCSSKAICRATLAEPALETDKPETDVKGSAMGTTDEEEDDDEGVHERVGEVRISVPGSFWYETEEWRESSEDICDEDRSGGTTWTVG